MYLQLSHMADSVSNIRFLRPEQTGDIAKGVTRGGYCRTHSQTPTVVTAQREQQNFIVRSELGQNLYSFQSTTLYTSKVWLVAMDGYTMGITIISQLKWHIAVCKFKVFFAWPQQIGMKGNPPQICTIIVPYIPKHCSQEKKLDLMLAKLAQMDWTHGQNEGREIAEKISETKKQGGGRKRERPQWQVRWEDCLKRDLRKAEKENKI